MVKQHSAGYVPGEHFEARVERLVPGGSGLVRGPKGVVFVDGAAPGDVLRIKVESIRAGAPRGSVLEILSPGPGRIDARCPWYGTCGGCDFQHLSYQTQIEAKVQIVGDALRRTAGIEPPAAIEVFAAPRPFESRSRVELHVDQSRREIGFFARRSRKIVPINQCVVARTEINEALQVIRVTDKQLPASIHVLCGDGVGHAHPPLPSLPSGPFWISVGEFDYLVDPASFFQSSLDLLPALIRRVIDSLPSGGEFAWDLFCGAGLFTLPLSRLCPQVMGIDIDANTISNAKSSATRNEAANVLFVASDVTHWISKQLKSSTWPALIVVDPPRSGLERKLAEILAARALDRLTYVSCDPTTLARDLKILVAGGFRLLDVAIFDLFPQTHHVETVVRLERVKRP